MNLNVEKSMIKMFEEEKLGVAVMDKSGKVLLTAPPEPGEAFMWMRLCQEMVKNRHMSQYINPNTSFLALHVPQKYLDSDYRMVGYLQIVQKFGSGQEVVEITRGLRDVLRQLVAYRNPDYQLPPPPKDWFFHSPGNLVALDTTKKPEDPYVRKKRKEEARLAKERRDHNNSVLRTYGLGKYGPGGGGDRRR